jgi:molybdopterin-containing oxidoreductase family membrane subunit
VWGSNVPVAWAFPIINFVFWIGIGHAGTFISAFLLVMAQEWRASINRIAEAMTLIALVNAGLFPVLHLGRPWFAYWLIPYPATMGVWPQFKSSLPWDVAAVFTYFTVSLLFWFVGLVPDFATLRDRARNKTRRLVYGALALGWRGSAEQWQHYAIMYGLLGGLATPLVISVHSVVSLDFAIAQLPGWHSTIFPPYFVVGAIYSGLGMVLCLVIPIRWYYGLQRVITPAHLEKLAKLTLAMCWMMTYSYAIETFIGWYSGDRFEQYMFLFYRPFSTYGIVYWLMLACNVFIPQALWSRRVRRTRRRGIRVLAAVVHRRRVVSAERGRPSCPRRPGLHPHHVRDGRSHGVLHRVLRRLLPARHATLLAPGLRNRRLRTGNG